MEPPGHALLCFPHFRQGDRPIQPHTFRSEQKSKISTVTIRHNDSSIHTVLNQTPGHLQNYAGFKIWKGGGVWKELWKKQNKNKNLSACWFPTFENLVTAAHQWPECARHGQCCAESAVQWALCRERAHSPTAVSKHKESNYQFSKQPHRCYNLEISTATLSPYTVKWFQKQIKHTIVLQK